MSVIKLHLCYRLGRKCTLEREKNLELHDKVITWFLIIIVILHVAWTLHVGIKL